MSHGGLLGTQEAMYYGKPFINLPVWLDQPRNSMRIQNSGLGKMLTWETLTEKDLYDAIMEVMHDPRLE